MFRKNFTENHLFCLRTTARMVNSTARAISIAHDSGSPDYWRRYLGDLERQELLESKNVYAGGERGGMRLGSFFCLTAKGAAMLEEMTGEADIFHPKGGIMAASPFQFPHRATFIETMAAFIALERRNPEHIEVLELIPYFRHEGSKRLSTGRAYCAVDLPPLPTHSKPAVLVPDAMIKIRTGEKVRLIALELHRETDTARIIRQLQMHAQAIDADIFPQKFGHQSRNLVFSIHTEPDKLKRVISRIRSGEFRNFERYEKGYYFTSVEDIKTNGVESALYSLHGEKCGIFHCIDFAEKSIQ